jgi:hypothetical protein
VVGEGRNAAFKRRFLTAARRLHPDPSKPVARRVGPER